SGAARQGIEDQIAFDVDWLTGRQQFVLALSATEGLSKSFVLQSVAFPAVRASQEQPTLVRFNVTHVKRRLLCDSDCSRGLWPNREPGFTKVILSLGFITRALTRLRSSSQLPFWDFVA